MPVIKTKTLFAELEDEIFQNLSRIPHARVYRRKDIPEEYHYKYNIRIPMIILEPEEHYWVSYNGSTGNGKY